MRLRGFRALSPDEMERIHEASIRILERVGVEVQSTEVLRLLDEAGAHVDFGSRRVYSPQKLVEEAMKCAPQEMILYDRNLEPSIRLESGKIYATTGSNSKLVVDLDTDEYRPSTKQDAADFARLADGLHNIFVVIPEVNPQDVLPESSVLHAVEAVFEHTEKHVLCEVHEPESALVLFEMAQAVAGNTRLGDKPLFSVYCSSTSPLVWSRDAVEALVETAKWGIPCNIIPCPLPGMTSPISLAGTMVQQNAEFLSGAVITQLVRRGTPILYFSPPLSTDMRYGSAVYSGPEVMLLGVAGRQMAEFYQIPFFQSGFDTDAQCVDVQSAWDKALPVLAGLGEVGTIFKNAGSIGNGLIASHVHMVLDDEFFGICLRLIEGIEVSTPALASEVIEAVASGGNYLSQLHTLEYLRKEHRIPQILNRLTYDRWREAGGKNVMEVARERARAILHTHDSKPLDGHVQQMLREAVLDFEKARSVQFRS